MLVPERFAMTPRLVLLTALGCFVLTPLAPAALDPTETTVVEKKYRLKMPVRKAVSNDPNADPRSFFVDALFDKTAGRLFYVAQETATLAVVAAEEKSIGNNKPAKTLHRYVLKVREWDEKEFSDKTRRIAIEVFRDENTGNVVYVSETGAVAVVGAPREAPEKKALRNAVKAPAPKTPDARWLYRLPLKVRVAGEANFDFHKMVRCNIEVYRETDSGRLIYITDNGNLAVSAAGKDFDAKEAKEAEWSHAFDLRARKPNEIEFTPETPLFGLEVYHDGNSETTIYLTQTRTLAVRPGIKKIDNRKVQPAEWRQALTTGKWSAEEFLDPNLDHLMLITSDGAFAVRPAK
jgi:hypothetical protein